MLTRLSSLRQCRQLVSLSFRKSAVPPTTHPTHTADTRDISDDLSNRPLLNLTQFYSQMDETELSDEKALSYMTLGAKLSNLTFKDEAEMLSYRNDFNQALKFISILDTLEVTEKEPCGNVLEVYGGNWNKMRTAKEYERLADED